MKRAVITFTYKPDLEKAKFSLQFVPKDFDVYWALSKQDINLEVPERVTKIQLNFKTLKLCSNEMIYGFRDILLELTANRGYDYVVKLDSDTVIYEPSVITVPMEVFCTDFAYLRRHPSEYHKPIGNGICYAMSSRGITMLNGVNFDALIKEHHGAEDHILSDFFTANKYSLVTQWDKTKVDWCGSKFIDARAIFGHYGYISLEEMKSRAKEILGLKGGRLFK